MLDQVKSSTNPQQIPCLLTLSVGNVSDDLVEITRLGIDLVVVVDISGSMRGEKIGLCLKTLEFLVDEMSCKDRLSIVLFNKHGW